MKQVETAIIVLVLNIEVFTNKVFLKIKSLKKKKKKKTDFFTTALHTCVVLTKLTINIQN